ncbi:hypothetical protein K7X08_021355 [Anisodus acutangulus]|uniref:Uncharacterized protein n=1 Tax=Anisodus acutangulus TaxID=402998 RepID=A0A9Q1RAZ8_9SOLA|nr:hypothetical protein K7X08_021355 [Anisodus acutangulus]
MYQFTPSIINQCMGLDTEERIRDAERGEETEGAQDSEVDVVVAAEEVVDSSKQRKETVGIKVLLKRLRMRAEGEAVMQK